MFPFMILIEPYAIYVRSLRSFQERPPQNNSRDRWQEVQAGSAAQAMGMGWQIRNAPLWDVRVPERRSTFASGTWSKPQ